MSRATYPRIIELWGHTWRKPRGGQVWLGPAITTPEDPSLAWAVEYERIVRRDGRYVLEDPGLTLDRFGWDEDDAEGLTLTTVDGEVIPLGEADEEDADA
jgi:hypothetical protein